MKMSQTDNEIDKKPKVFQLSKILGIFPQYFDSLRQLEG